MESLKSSPGTVRDRAALHRSYMNRVDGPGQHPARYSYWEQRKRFNLLENLFPRAPVDAIERANDAAATDHRTLYDNELSASLQYVRWICEKYRGNVYVCVCLSVCFVHRAVTYVSWLCFVLPV